MKQKSIKNIRQEFKDNGIFYTPPELAEKLKSYVDFEPKSVYDPTCGAGNLLRVFPDNVKKYGQELDAEQLGLIDIPNFAGYAGDTLVDDGFSGMKFDCIVANPPFSVKWNPDNAKNDERFQNIPVLPPPSKADWAFMIHIISHLSDHGVAINTYMPYESEKEDIDPSVLENEARRLFLERLRKELDFDKIVCEMEGISMQPFINAIKAVIREYDKRQVKKRDENQITIFDLK